jgi:hypothetical protein
VHPSPSSPKVARPLKSTKHDLDLNHALIIQYLWHPTSNS